MKKPLMITLAAAALAGVLTAKFCTGCASLETARTEARPAVLFVLKEAYACGGATAVSNRIERLVIDGKVTPEQAANLHRIAQDVYDGIVDRLEAKVIEDALATTNGTCAACVEE